MTYLFEMQPPPHDIKGQNGHFSSCPIGIQTCGPNPQAIMGHTGARIKVFLGVTQSLLVAEKVGPGPASSEVEHSLRKIVFSGDPSLNPASSKKTPRVFRPQIFA